jgi:hypothetical protein
MTSKLQLVYEHRVKVLLKPHGDWYFEATIDITYLSMFVYVHHHHAPPFVYENNTCHSL